MSRRGTTALLAWLALAVSVLIAAPVWAEAPIGSAGTADGPADDERPDDAPWLANDVDVPAIPPEYLKHDGGWIQLAYHPSARERVRPLIERADGIRDQLRKDLGTDVLERAEVRIAAIPAEIARLAPAEHVGPRTAVAFGAQSLIVMSLASPLEVEPTDLETTFRHLLAHLALDDALAGHSVPAWFHEAFAVQVSGQDVGLRAQTMALASLRRQLLPMRHLGVRYPESMPQASIARAQSVDFVQYLKSQDDEGLGMLMDALRRESSFERALEATYGTDAASLENAWRRDVARRYSFLPIMLAGALVWLLVATGAVIRRSRAARRARREEAELEEAQREAEIEEATAQAAEAREEEDDRIRMVIAAPRIKGAKTLPPTPDVPKIEHEGDWHTLH